MKTEEQTQSQQAPEEQAQAQEAPGVFEEANRKENHKVGNHKAM